MVQVAETTHYETQYRHGRLPAVDERDKGYRARTKPTDLRRKMWTASPILNQGNTSQCVIYSGDGWLGASPIRNKGFGTAERRHVVYKEVQRLDEWPGENYEGTSVRAILKWMQQQGYVTNYGWADTVDQMANHILNYSPMMIGIDWTEEMDFPDKYGYIWTRGRVIGGHALYVPGVDLDRKNPDNTRGAFRKCNSWGRGWAQNGRCWITFGEMGKLLKGLEGWPGEAATATEVIKV
jgi:hypothetical protein